MRRKGLRRVMAGVAFILVAAGIWAAFNWDGVKTRYAEHRFTSAATDDERTRWADALASGGDAGERRLIDLLRADEPSIRAAAAGALNRRLAALPENDAHAALLAGQLIELFAPSDAAHRESLVGLLPNAVARCGAIHWAKCKEAAAAALKMPSAQSRVIAIHVAIHPHVGLRNAVVPLLNDAQAEVRRAALFAIGPAADNEPVIGDEELFRWLHDPDAGVRTICRDALISRGRTDVEIGLGRRLVDPQATERLQLLLDLRYDDDLADPEPWLERLSRDADPAVRAGAIRVAMELAMEKHLPSPPWVKRSMESDPERTVRRIAAFYQSLSQRPTEEGIRLINGP